MSEEQKNEAKTEIYKHLKSFLEVTRIMAKHLKDPNGQLSIILSWFTDYLVQRFSDVSQNNENQLFLDLVQFCKLFNKTAILYYDFVGLSQKIMHKKYFFGK